MDDDDNHDDENDDDDEKTAYSEGGIESDNAQTIAVSVCLTRRGAFAGTNCARYRKCGRAQKARTDQGECLGSSFRAASPSIELSVMKSDFKCKNWTLSVIHCIQHCLEDSSGQILHLLAKSVLPPSFSVNYVI